MDRAALVTEPDAETASARTSTFKSGGRPSIELITRAEPGRRPIISQSGGKKGCPEIWGIMTIGIGPAGYVAGWGFADGMDAAFGRDGE
jgi:hypothetical protein